MESEITHLIIKNVIYEGERNELLNFKDDENKISIFISSIEPELKESIENNHGFVLHDKQLIISLHVEFPNKKPVYFYKKEIQLYKDVVFSFLLSIKDFHIVWERDPEREDMGITNGAGTGLPFAIFKFTEKGEYVNVVYANDYEKIRFPHNFFVILETKNVNLFQEILQKVLIENIDVIPEFIRESFSLIHTINWVKEGFFYLAAIILFSCFESLLNKKVGEQIKDLIISKGIELTENEKNYLQNFQKLRNAIAHPSEYKIVIKNNVYHVYKKGKIEATFDIKELESIRKILVNLIIHNINE